MRLAILCVALAGCAGPGFVYQPIPVGRPYQVIPPAQMPAPQPMEPMQPMGLLATFTGRSQPTRTVTGAGTMCEYRLNGRTFTHLIAGMSACPHQLRVQ